MGFLAPVSPGRACRDDKLCPFFYLCVFIFIPCIYSLIAPWAIFF